MKYTIINSENIEEEINKTKNGGIEYPYARLNNDKTKAIITWEDKTAPENSLTLDELEVFLGANREKWEQNIFKDK